MTSTPLHPLTSDKLISKNIRHAFFTREGGVSTGLYASLNGGLGSSDDIASVRENRRRMAHHLGITSDSLLSLYQIHSSECVTVTAPFPVDERPRADAMATNLPGVALAIGTADCGPLLFADPAARVIGAAHAGWKGALHGVIERTIEAMENLGASSSKITAVLGPTISQQAYEVGSEFRDTFIAADAESASFFTPPHEGGKTRFDLPGYITLRLRRAAIGTIENLALCTYADEQRFFSFRRTTHRGEADYGRLIAAITLTGD